MFNPQTLENLYETISKDLQIERFSNEGVFPFRRRLIYSAVAKWIMQVFSDRDFEDLSLDQVSKSHVTLVATDLLRSYKKIDPGLNEYFLNDKDFVNDIENIYINLGYINTGSYSFKYQSKRRRVSLGNHTLTINADTHEKRMVGVGMIADKKDTDLGIDSFLLANEEGEKCFKNILRSLDFFPFHDDYGKTEIYNVEHNRWDSYSQKQAEKFEYSILKIDGGLDYKVLRNNKGEIYAASLPIIYSKAGADCNFVHEVWRIILGLCSYVEHPAVALIEDYDKNAIKISMGGYILPFDEYSFLKCIAWPFENSLGINTFVTYADFKDDIIKLLRRLSITTIE